MQKYNANKCGLKKYKKTELVKAGFSEKTGGGCDMHNEDLQIVELYVQNAHKWSEREGRH